ncbi:hypothetical protein VE04_01599 [Pseudogymnoascus sp. 24MN13]|nr:hypothetical protein VE04_01599 [Pseudogymnoascus sp. 24MN13]
MGHLTPTTLQTIDISLSGDNHSAKTPRPVHTYTTYDDIRGHVAISALTPTPFSRVEIVVRGTTRTAHRITPSPSSPSHSKPWKILSSAIRKFHVVPASEEAPPLLVLKESQYVLSKSKTMRKGMFRGKLGTLTLTTTQPRAFSLPPPRTCGPLAPFALTDLTLTLRFDPTDPSCAPPRLGALSAWIRATTVHSINPASRMPDQELQGSPYDSHSRAFKTYVALAAQDVPAAAAPLWRVVPAPKYARRDSGYSTAWSLSPTPSPNSSPTPLATSTGPLVSVSAASASGDVDEVDDKKPYYTTIALRLVLAPSRTWIPTFHSCFVSRFYTLVLELVVHPPGAAMPFMLSLEVPVQVIGQGREGRKEAFVAGGRAGSVGMGEGGDMRGLGGVWDGYAAGGGESVDAYGGCGGEEMGQGDELLPAQAGDLQTPRDGNDGGLGKAAVDGGLARTLSQRLATTVGDDGS